MIADALGGHRPRCRVSDRWGAQQGHAATHQVCLAHVLCDVQYAVDAGERRFAPVLRRLLCWAIAVHAARLPWQPGLGERMQVVEEASGRSAGPSMTIPFSAAVR